MSDEIIEEILLYIPGQEIPDLMVVSKKFSDVIGNSVKLMENFEVQWEKNKERGDMRPLLKSKRKYRKLQVLSVTGINRALHRFFSNHATTLTSIYFHDCAMSSTELRSILTRLAANLKEVNMCEVNFELDCDVEPIKMPQLHEMEIMYGRGDGYISILQFFSGARVKRFQYEDDYEMDPAEVKKFSEVIASFKDLDEISLSSSITQKLFSDSDFANSSKLQLKQIFLWVNGPEHQNEPLANDDVYANLQIFLENHRNTLKTLTLARSTIKDEMMTFLLQFQLKDLRLVYSDFVWRKKIGVKNLSVKRIFISMQEIIEGDTETAVTDILKSCVSLKTLRFSCVDISFEISMVMAYHMQQLEELELYQCDFIPVTYPKLKKLEVSSCEREDVIRLIRVNRQLQNLLVPSSYRFSARFARAIDEMSVKEIVYQ